MGTFDSGSWDMAVHRSVVDPAYRRRLLDAPVDALAELGVTTDGITVRVRELVDGEVVLTLPPVARQVGRPRSYGDGLLTGLAACALTDPDDERVGYGGAPRGKG